MQCDTYEKKASQKTEKGRMLKELTDKRRDGDKELKMKRGCGFTRKYEEETGKECFDKRDTRDLVSERMSSTFCGYHNRHDSPLHNAWKKALFLYNCSPQEMSELVSNSVL